MQVPSRFLHGQRGMILFHLRSVPFRTLSVTLHCTFAAMGPAVLSSAPHQQGLIMFHPFALLLTMLSANLHCAFVPLCQGVRKPPLR